MWAASLEPDVVVVWVDCEVERTEAQFVRAVCCRVVGGVKGRE